MWCTHFLLSIYYISLNFHESLNSGSLLSPGSNWAHREQLFPISVAEIFLPCLFGKINIVCILTHFYISNISLIFLILKYKIPTSVYYKLFLLTYDVKYLTYLFMKWTRNSPDIILSNNHVNMSYYFRIWRSSFFFQSLSLPQKSYKQRKIFQQWHHYQHNWSFQPFLMCTN